MLGYNYAHIYQGSNAIIAHGFDMPRKVAVIKYTFYKI